MASEVRLARLPHTIEQPLVGYIRLAVTSPAMTCSGVTLGSVETVAMKIRAMSVEPGLGMAHMRTDPLDQPPEPARVIHLDQMSNLMGSEIFKHKWRRQN